MDLQAVAEAGLTIESKTGGSHLVVQDARPDGYGIRNRGGEALARFIARDCNAKVLDVRQSQISDNGIAHICLSLRQTDRLEELYFSPVGHTGLEFITGVVKRCKRLQTLFLEVHDVPSLHVGRQNLSEADYDTSAYVPGKKPDGEDDEEEAEEGEGEEEEKEPDDSAPEDEEPEQRAERKANKLKKIFAADDYDSDEERRKTENKARKKAGKPLLEKPSAAKEPSAGQPSAKFLELLADFVDAVKKRDNLVTVECSGDTVPSDVLRDLERAIAEHAWQREQRRVAREEKGARTAQDVLKDQAVELRAALESASASDRADISALLGEEDLDLPKTRLGVRSFVNRRLFAALGEALFECQRFKSKENEAVATAQGEMAFIAMYLRKQAKAAAEEAAKPRRPGASAS